MIEKIHNIYFSNLNTRMKKYEQFSFWKKECEQNIIFDHLPALSCRHSFWLSHNKFYIHTPGPWLLRISVVPFSLMCILKKAQISSLCNFHNYKWRDSFTQSFSVINDSIAAGFGSCGIFPDLKKRTSQELKY